MLDELTRTAPDERTKIEPPKRWRNWWRAKSPVAARCSECRKTTLTFPGAIIEPPCNHFMTYPAKDIAEIAASKAGAWLDVAEHVCATPVDERP